MEDQQISLKERHDIHATIIGFGVFWFSKGMLGTTNSVLLGSGVGVYSYHWMKKNGHGLPHGFSLGSHSHLDSSHEHFE